MKRVRAICWAAVAAALFALPVLAQSAKTPASGGKTEEVAVMVVTGQLQRVDTTLKGQGGAADRVISRYWIVEANSNQVDLAGLKAGGSVSAADLDKVVGKQVVVTGQANVTEGKSGTGTPRQWVVIRNLVSVKEAPAPGK